MILKRQLPQGEHNYKVTFVPFFPDFEKTLRNFYLFSLEVEVPGSRSRKMDVYRNMAGTNNEDRQFLRIAHDFTCSSGTIGGLPYDKIVKIHVYASHIPYLRREAYSIGLEFLEGKLQDLSALRSGAGI